MKIMKIFSIMLTTMLVLMGCNSTPTTNQPLEYARHNYSLIQNDAQVATFAPLELKQATDQLHEAGIAVQQRKDSLTIDHLAYMTTQRVAIAVQMARIKAAEQQIQNTTAQRNNILLQGRAAEVASLQEQLNAQNSGRGLVVTMNDVLFDTNKAQLKSGSERKIEKLANFLQKNANKKVLVEGFTDNTGGADYNSALSEARADAVRTALVDLGVDASRVMTRGYGEAFPVAGNGTSAGRQLNRRVEIIISKNNQNISAR